MNADCQPLEIQLECRFGKLSALEWIGSARTSSVHTNKGAGASGKDGVRLKGADWVEPSKNPNASGKNITIVALHGWLDNAASFSRLAPALIGQLTASKSLHSIDQVRLVALDLPGHGRSDWLPQVSGCSPDYHIWTPAQALSDVLNQLPQSAHLLGHSMGAASGLLFAGAMPERLKSLVSLDVLGPIVEPPERASERFRQSLLRSSFLRQASGKSKKQGRLYDSVAEAVEARLKAGSINPGMTTECIEPIVVRNLTPREQGWAWRTDPALKRPNPFRLTPDILDAFLRSAMLPVQFMGAKQGLAAQLDLAGLAQKLPEGTQLSLPGHHHFHLEPSTSDRVAEEVGAFIRHVESR